MSTTLAADETKPVGQRVVLVTGLAVMALYLAGLLVAMIYTGYDSWGGMAVGPALILLSLPLLARQARRENSRGLFGLLVLALVVRFGAAAIGELVAFRLYEGNVDLAGYHRKGLVIAERFRSGNFDPGLPGGIAGLNFPSILNGAIYALIGPTRLGGFQVHSWLAFWGLFMFYRAFTIAVPNGRARTYARLIFFLPSQVFWSSYMGKDPWMALALGVLSYGVARALTGRLFRGMSGALLGSSLAGLVRPHMAGIAGASFAAAYLVARPRQSLRQLAPVVKVASMAVVATLTIVLLGNTQAYLEKSGVDTDKGTTAALQGASSQGAFGNSAFQPVIVRSPIHYPFAAVTVLFRPFVFEARNVLALVTALECSLLLWLTAVRLRSILAGLRRVREQPYIAYAAVYTAIFVFAFSAIGNFGLLARQRIMLLPVYAVLLALPIPSREEAA